MKSKLKSLRKEAGFTQRNFVIAVRLSQSHYCRIESGKAKPSLGAWLRIKQTLNYPYDDIYAA